MSKCLAYYCDTTQTQKLMKLYGDRLQKLSKSDLVDFISVFSFEINHGDIDSNNIRSGDLISQQLSNAEISDDLETAFDTMDYFDRDMGYALLFGLSACL